MKVNTNISIISVHPDIWSVLAHARLDTGTERATQARLSRVRVINRLHTFVMLSCEKRSEGNAHASAEAVTDHCIIMTFILRTPDSLNGSPVVCVCVCVCVCVWVWVWEREREIVCVCVCVCVCERVCGFMWFTRTQICLITWVWQRYYNLKVFYEDTAYVPVIQKA